MGCEARLAVQLLGYMVYLFPFARWQHRVDAAMVNRHTDTHSLLLLTGYTISSASSAENVYEELKVNISAISTFITSPKITPSSA